MAPTFALRDNQKPILARFKAEIAKGITGWLLNMPTGAGKTVCACAMLSLLGRTTLIIVPRESLMSQWCERIMAFTDIKEEEIGIAQQSMCLYEGKKVVLGMIHSLAKDKYSQKFYDSFGLVIWDEVHVAGAQSFSTTLSLFAPKYRIGMSATLKRADGLEELYKQSIGESYLAIAQTTLLQPLVSLQPFKTANIDRTIFTVADNTFRRGKIISQLAEDPARNALIAKHLADVAKTGRRTVCFSERIQQLITLKDSLCQDHGLNPATIGLFTGQTKAQDRQRILKESQIILATYGVMAMGVDVPDLRAIVFGTPQANVAQAVGRILRLHDHTLEPLVVDIVDVSYLDCHYWAESRKRYYTNIAKASITVLPEVVAKSQNTAKAHDDPSKEGASQKANVQKRKGHGSKIQKNKNIKKVK